MRRRVAAALLTLAAIIVLVGLGLWQLERRAWKEALIAQREAALTAPPSAAPQGAAGAQALSFHPVVAEGVFLLDKALLLHAIGPKGAAGFDVLTPLREASGRMILVRRGFVAMAAKNAAGTGAAPGGPVRVEGLLRLPAERKPNWFTPDNRPATNDWYWIDIKAMAAAQGLAGLAPFYIDVDMAPAPLPNDHLQYAITWFSLAAAAMVIYVLSQHGSLRGGKE